MDGHLILCSSLIFEMRFTIVVAAACILACVASARAQQPPGPLPSTMQVVRLQDLSQPRKDLASGSSPSPSHSHFL
jgi:hypothetical protein